MSDEARHCEECACDLDNPCPGLPPCPTCASKSAELGHAKAFIADIEAALEGKTPPGFDLNNASAVGAVLRLQAACTAKAQEIATLEAALRHCGEALATVEPWCMVSHGHTTCDLAKVQAALALAPVRKAMGKG